MKKTYGEGPIYCGNCARQIVSYNVSNSRTVGKGSYTPARDVASYICHECIGDENEFYRLMEDEHTERSKSWN